ncbi:MAG TPA: type II toxin-antitoxin system HicB family antitoxin [Candidatus Solibacter sp.]|nr:type II toxin-antitoxin system HicB family antitoxin [Candidatus Solibacter sp.]
MTYKGYQSKVELDEEAGVFHGEAIDTRDAITFQGSSVKELKKAFEDSVDDYLDFCASRGEDAEKPFSGKFLVRVPPEVHRQIMTEAKRQGKSLNAYVVEKLAGIAAIGGVCGAIGAVGADVFLTKPPRGTRPRGELVSDTRGAGSGTKGRK